jgi:hypothetical protein
MTEASRTRRACRSVRLPWTRTVEYRNTAPSTTAPTEYSVPVMPTRLGSRLMGISARQNHSMWLAVDSPSGSTSGCI